MKGYVTLVVYLISSAIIDEFVKTQAMIRNKILTKEGNGSKTIGDQMSMMYGEHTPSYYQVEIQSKQLKWGRNLVEDNLKLQRPADDNGPK